MPNPIITIAGGHVFLIVVLWIISGLIGVMVRVWLFRKYEIDLAVSMEARRSQARQEVSRHAIRSTILHVVVKLLIIAIGLAVAIAEWNDPRPAPPLDAISISLLLLPWLLTYDGIAEFRHQRWLLTQAAAGA